MDNNKIKTVFVAMSGGVDSSVAALLLKQQGYKVVGVFFKPWQPRGKYINCNWQKDRQDALAVASKLKIDFKTWDFSKEYKHEITDYMIQSYKNGFTPNPDIVCNEKIKFGIFLKKALARGADFIATGHYARLKYNKKENAYELHRAEDTEKDQTYFLYKLKQKQLKYCFFPIGNYKKQDVRKMAKK